MWSGFKSISEKRFKLEFKLIFGYLFPGKYFTLFSLQVSSFRNSLNPSCMLFFRCVVLVFLMNARIVLAQAEEQRSSETTNPNSEGVIPMSSQEYEWYQYVPGDSLIPDTGLPKLPVWSFGFRGGNVGYLGDLNAQQANPFSGGFQPGIGLMATRHLSKMFETSLEFHYIGLNGGQEGIAFSGSGMEFTGNVTLNITRSFSGANALKRKLNFYTFLGTGFLFFNSTLTGSPEPVLPVKSTELVLATGISAGYRITPKLEAGAVFSYRYLNSDRLDGFANPYTGNDSYTLLGLSLRYSISKPSIKEEDIVSRLKKEMLAYMTVDTDGDGVPDYLDKDNTTPAGIEVGSRGRALDTDGDGIADAQDTDPFTPPGTAVDEKGMPSDRDGDAVPDYRDSEPDSKEKQIVNFQGKAIIQKEKVKPNQAPDTNTDMIRRVLSTWNLSLIRFAPGSFLVEEKYYQGLSEMAFLMQAQPDIQARVIGHTDTQGNARQNDQLARQRAEEVLRIMTEIYGIDKSRFSAEAASDKQPLNQGGQSSKDTGANRRVEIRIVFKGTEIR